MPVTVSEAADSQGDAKAGIVGARSRDDPLKLPVFGIEATRVWNVAPPSRLSSTLTVPTFPALLVQEWRRIRVIGGAPAPGEKTVSVGVVVMAKFWLVVPKGGGLKAVWGHAPAGGGRGRTGDGPVEGAGGGVGWKADRNGGRERLVRGPAVSGQLDAHGVVRQQVVRQLMVAVVPTNNGALGALGLSIGVTRVNDVSVNVVWPCALRAVTRTRTGDADALVGVQTHSVLVGGNPVQSATGV